MASYAACRAEQDEDNTAKRYGGQMPAHEIAISHLPSSAEEFRPPAADYRAARPRYCRHDTGIGVITLLGAPFFTPHG